MAQRLPYRCAECNSQWPEDHETCVFCGHTERIRNTEPVLDTPMPPSLQPLWNAPPAPAQRVVITDIKLTWGSAFDVAFKFFCVLAVIQFIFLGLAYALFG